MTKLLDDLFLFLLLTKQVEDLEKDLKEIETKRSYIASFLEAKKKLKNVC